MKGHIIKSILFVVICGLLFYAVQGVMTPDFYYNQNVNYSIDSFDNFEKDSMDVVFLGQSQGLLCISPMKLYEDTGICSYNLATSGQPIALSYHLCKHVLKRQSPKVVFLNAGNLFYPNIGFENWRFVMDNMPLSREKIEMARDFASWPGSDSFLSAIFPLLRYHTRWDELTSDDFQKRETEYYYTAGQYLMNYSWPNDLGEEGMNAAAEGMEERNTATVHYTEGGQVAERTIDTPLYNVSIWEENINYLYKICDLCQEAKAELVLMGLPNRVYPMKMIYSWTREMCETSRSLANELGIRYFDAAYDVDAGLDYTIDTYDDGTHLNLFGAEKVTKVFEQYLAENFQIEQNKNPIWDGMLEKYQNARSLACLQNIKDPTSYLAELVRNKETWAIMIAASNEYTTGLTEEMLTYFDQLGLQLIREGQWTDSYLAVIQNDQVEYETTSPRRVDYATTVGGGIPVSVASAGFFNGAMASVMIDGRESTMNQFGLNIVVVDQETGIVLDSAAMNTGTDDVTVTHEKNREFFTAYEDAVLLAR